MRVISCSLRNFASYKTLEFDFENQGLTLIQGATGSGKSTLCDAIPWILFGRTAKDGAVDEVISWNSEAPTIGTVNLEINSRTYTIQRRRAPNDLYFYEYTDYADCTPIRGKDLNDTQKLINSLLGLDSSLYLSGAYFHEFSQTAQFFTTTAKNRRAICEQLVDLSLAKTLQTKLTEQRKTYEGTEKSYVQKIQSYGDRIQYLARHNDYLEKSENFEQDKEKDIQKYCSAILGLTPQIKSSEYFAVATKQLNECEQALGNEVCKECGSKKNSGKHEALLKMRYELRSEIAENNMLKDTLSSLKANLEEAQEAKNLYAELINSMEKETASATKTYAEYKSLLEVTKLDLADIELLQDIVNDFRGVAIKNTIQSLENQTNKLLSDHFDAEIRVLFSVEDADKLDVTIMKDGNICAYTQLSKGQRQLLKLAFGVSVMRTVANHHGVYFNCAFFDEAFDGMDDNFKSKTFRLLQELALEYESVLVVEHNETIKSLFINKFSVELVNGNSVINAT